MQLVGLLNESFEYQGQTDATSGMTWPRFKRRLFLRANSSHAEPEKNFNFFNNLERLDFQARLMLHAWRGGLKRQQLANTSNQTASYPNRPS